MELKIIELPKRNCMDKGQFWKMIENIKIEISKEDKPDELLFDVVEELVLNVTGKEFWERMRELESNLEF